MLNSCGQMWYHTDTCVKAGDTGDTYINCMIREVQNYR